jgi:hypothetical protein
MIEGLEAFGSPSDPNCLHCHLAPILAQWRTAHPDQKDADQIGAIAQVLGELIASSAVDSGHADRLERITREAMYHALESARDLVRTLEKRGRTT